MTEYDLSRVDAPHAVEIKLFQFGISEAVAMIEAGQVADGVKLLRVLVDCGPSPPDRRRPVPVPDGGDAA